jgi:hypothetical protein
VLLYNETVCDCCFLNNPSLMRGVGDTWPGGLAQKLPGFFVGKKEAL